MLFVEGLAVVLPVDGARGGEDEAPDAGVLRRLGDDRRPAGVEQVVEAGAESGHGIVGKPGHVDDGVDAVEPPRIELQHAAGDQLGPWIQMIEAEEAGVDDSHVVPAVDQNPR